MSRLSGSCIGVSSKVLLRIDKLLTIMILSYLRLHWFARELSYLLPVLDSVLLPPEVDFHSMDLFASVPRSRYYLQVFLAASLQEA